MRHTHIQNPISFSLSNVNGRRYHSTYSHPVNKIKDLCFSSIKSNHKRQAFISQSFDNRSSIVELSSSCFDDDSRYLLMWWYADVTSMRNTERISSISNENTNSSIEWKLKTNLALADWNLVWRLKSFGSEVHYATMDLWAAALTCPVGSGVQHCVRVIDCQTSSSFTTLLSYQ